MHLVVGILLFVFGAMVPVSSIAAQVSPTASFVIVDVKGASLVNVKDKNGVVRVSIKSPRNNKKGVLPHHLYLVIDNSGSMEGNRIKAVGQALLTVKDYVKKNAPALPVTIITFNNTAKVEFVEKTSEEKLSTPIRTEGGTNFLAPVKLLKDEIDKSSAIPLAILLTDGESYTLNSQTFAPLKGFQVELVGVGIGADMDTLGHVAKSLNNGLHYLPDDTKVLFGGTPEKSPLGSLVQLLLSRINDVVVGPMTIKAQIPEGSSAKFIGSSLSKHIISADGRHIEVTIPSLADEEEAVVDFYVNGVVNGEISVNVAHNKVEFVVTKIKNFIDDLGVRNTYEELYNGFVEFSNDLKRRYPVPEHEDLIWVQEQIAQLIESIGNFKGTSQFKNALSPDLKQDVERAMISIRYKYAGPAMEPKKLHLEQDLAFEKTFSAQDALKAKTDRLKQVIHQSTSNNALVEALKAFMGNLQQEPTSDLVAELLSAVDEMAKEFKIAAEKGIGLEEGRRFLLASIHNIADNHVSNTPGASQGTKAQKSFKEKFLDNTKSALIGAGKDASAVEAFGSVLSGLPTQSALRSASARIAPATTAQQPPEGNVSSGSVSDIRSRFEKKQ